MPTPDDPAGSPVDDPREAAESPAAGVPEGGPGGPFPEAADELRHEVEALRRENESLRAASTAAPSKSRRAGRLARKVVGWVLVVVACLLAVVSVLVVFVRNEVLNTDTYVATVQPLAADPAIQEAVADAVTKRLFDRVDVEQQVAGALPSRAGFLATPIALGIENTTRALTLKFIQSDQFQKLWAETNRAAHRQMVNLVTGSHEGALSSDSGKVTLDLGKVLDRVKSELDQNGITVFDKVPTTNGPEIVLFESDNLVKVQHLVRVLDRLAIVLPIVAIVCLVGSVLAAENRRRGLVRAAAGLAIAMALLLVGVAFGRHAYLAALSPSISPRAAANAYDAITSFPLGTTRTVLIVSAVVAVLAILAGNRRVRGWLRGVGVPSWMTDGPVHRWLAAHRKALRWGVAAIGLLVLVLWSNPTPLVALVVVLVTLAFVALVGIFGGTRVAPAPAGGPPVAPGPPPPADPDPAPGPSGITAVPPEPPPPPVDAGGATGAGGTGAGTGVGTGTGGADAGSKPTGETGRRRVRWLKSKKPASGNGKPPDRS